MRRLAREETVAQRVVLTDDLDGSEATQTLNYTVGGQEYEIDLSEESVQRFHEALEPFVSKSRQVEGPARVDDLESDRSGQEPVDDYGTPVPRGTVSNIGSEPTRLLQSTGNLYWTSNTEFEFDPNFSSVYRMSKTGTPGSQRLIYQEAGTKSFGALAYAKIGDVWFGYVVTQNYFQSPKSTIKRFPLAGDGTAETIVEHTSHIGDLVTNGTTLFWADDDGLCSTPIAGGAVRTLVSGPDINRIALGVGPYAPRVFYSAGRSVRYVWEADGSTALVATASTPITTLHVTMAANSLRVYWGERSGIVASKGLVGATSIDQGPQNGRYTTSVSFDGVRALWTDVATNGLQGAVHSRSGNTIETIADGPGFASEVQGDSVRTFWRQDGALKRYSR
jgi:hypothetical protein